MNRFIIIFLFICIISYCLSVYENVCKNINLNISHNEISIEESCTYTLNLNEIENDKDLLIYTNLNGALVNITQFDLIKYDNSTKNISFTANDTKTGFIDFKLVDKDKYTINKNITREEFYKKTIEMKKNKKDYSFYINLIPTDNNSDLYFFQTNKSSLRDENKDRLNLYYLNDFNNKDLEQIIKYINDHPMKRERNINGKAEIFGYSYENLDKDIYIKISYAKIKGDGILGPILSLSILFLLLIIVSAIFIKNTYYDSGYKIKRNSISTEEE